MISKSFRLVTLASGLALFGCAPVTFDPGVGIGVSTAPGVGLSVTSCSAHGISSEASRMGASSSAAVQAGEIQNRISAIQAQATPSYRYVRSHMSSWKRIAGGECQ